VKLKEMGIVTSGDAAKNGIGTINPERVKQSYAFLVENKLVDPTKVTPADAFNYDYIKDVKVLP
jgi:NitT/TauT family transport system substrate-binding protein